MANFLVFSIISSPILIIYSIVLLSLYRTDKKSYVAFAVIGIAYSVALSIINIFMFPALLVLSIGCLLLIVIALYLRKYLKSYKKAIDKHNQILEENLSIIDDRYVENFDEELYVQTVREAAYEEYVEQLLDDEKITKEEYEKYQRLVKRQVWNKLPKKIQDDVEQQILEALKDKKDEIIKTNEEIKTKCKQLEEDYKNSPLIKAKRNSFVIKVFSLIGLIISIVVDIIIGLSNAKTYLIISIPITILLLCVWIIFPLLNTQKYCYVCGNVGDIIDSEIVDKEIKLERNQITDTQVKTAKGHVTYDKQGNAYEEKLVTKSKYNITYKCPHCGEIWDGKYYKIEK